MAVIFGLNESAERGLDVESYMASVGGNSGNLAFHHALNLLCLGITGVIGWGNGDALGGLDKDDVVLLPCANQVGVHVDMGGMAEVFDAHLGCKLVAIGLGVQNVSQDSVPEIPLGTQTWIKSIVGAARGAGVLNILARGPYSSGVINSLAGYECSESFGCPSILISPQVGLGELIGSKVVASGGAYSRVAVLAGHNRWQDLAGVERSLVAYGRSSGSNSYILQSGDELFQMCDGVTAGVDIESIRMYCFGYSIPNDEFYGWIDSSWKYFHDIPSWLDCYRMHDIAIGTRIHGCVLALQAGIPACCIVHDSRTKELCQVLHVPYVEVSNGSDFSVSLALQAIADHDWMIFDINRTRIARQFHEFLSRNNLVSSAHLLGLCAY